MLEKYKEKRNFQKTPEPPPGEGPGKGPLTFVIQKHAATRLHYDFRLEIDGVLASWPVPKGPSLNPEDKRLAVMVEDHPLDYASFEGVIPKGEYGGGQVIVWDEGTYSPDEDGKLSFNDREEANRRMREGVKKGKLSVFLRGHKLHGSWTLVKIAGGKNDWLLIKHRDRFADPERDILEEDASVLSGLTIEDIKAGRLPARKKSRVEGRPEDLPGAVRSAFPKSVEPMHATLTDRAFSAEGWLFEPKLDGVRAIAYKNGSSVRLNSRRGLDCTRQYPLIAEELTQQLEDEVILDGEIVSPDDNGIPSFQRIQQRLGLQRDSDIRKAESLYPVLYYVFDVLYAGGYDLRGVPLSKRRDLLQRTLVTTDRVLLIEPFEEDGLEAYDAVRQVGLEGLIAKQANSLYESGKRSRSWLKVKATEEQEFVVGGFTQGEGGRSDSFGSLLLGYYDGSGPDRLMYVGNVGTGFDDKTLRSLRERLETLKSEESPFLQPINRSGMHFGRAKDTAVTWVKPELIAQVKFAQWTDDGHLRAPSFLGLRDDKAPLDVRREEAVPPPVAAPAEASNPSPSKESVVLGEVLEQLENPAEKMILRVDGHKISLTNLDKPLWPEIDGRRPLTKRDLLVYFARVAPYLLPHMTDRPLTLTRYPNGINSQHFYQKHWESKLPSFVETVSLYSGHNDADGEYLMCNNLPTLLWLGQLADIELHTWYSRIGPEPDAYQLPETYAGSEANIDASRLNFPDFIVFDLDPYIYSGKEAKGAEPELNRKAFLKTCDVALWLKELLDSLSLSSFVKTTGRTGLHVYVPIIRQFDYDSVRAACETIGRFLLRAHPKDITMEWSVAKRSGKVFFDHNQNVRGKTLASLYSPRPSPEAAVSMPVKWDEIKDIYPTDYTILTAPDHLKRRGDLWKEILQHKHDLSELLGEAG
jgi:bifunctional non-homologous end joining protein LigD